MAGLIVPLIAAFTGISGTGLAIAQIAFGLATSIVSQALKPQTNLKPQTARAKASEISSVVPKRFVYGRTKAPGVVVPYTVKGKRALVCLLLNSRRSAGPFSVLMDKRPVEFNATSPHDFGGPGARATNDPFSVDGSEVQMWIGLGDQTGPPAALLAEFSDYLLPTDAFRGCTVAWFRLWAGTPEVRAERFPRWLPEIEIEGDWSLIWDPSDPAQNPNDGTTWTFSRNRALIVLDFLRNNPVAQHRLINLDLDSFIAAANIDAEPVALKGGGTEARWTADGLILFDGIEVQEVAETLYAAGVGRLVRSGGRLRLTPGKWVPPAVTLDSALEDGEFEFANLQSDVPPEIEVRYVRPDMDWQEDSAGLWPVEGGSPGAAPLVLANPFITSATQAQRLAQHTARRMAAMREVRAVFGPEAFDTIGGDNATIDTPYAVVDGTYEVVEASPDLFPPSGGGVAMRVAMMLTETAEAHYAWNPATDERAVQEPPEQDPFMDDLAPPKSLVVATGATAGGNQPRIVGTFTPSTSGRVTDYEWQTRQSGGSWQPGGLIDHDVRNSAGKAFWVNRDVDVGETYESRVRAIEGDGAVSVWVASGPLVILPPGVSIPAPTGMTATGGVGQIAISARIPDEAGMQGVEFWFSSSTSSNTAVFLKARYGSPDSVVSHTHAVVGQRYYWAKAIGPYGAVSDFSTRANATGT